jgi:hypothetical protein
MFNSVTARAAAYKNIARNGTDHAPAAMRDAKWNKLLNQVDPAGILSEAERNKRAKALQKSQMIILAQKSVESRQRKACEKANKAIKAIADPDTACAWCGPVRRNQSHKTCEKHAAEIFAQKS